MSDDAISEAIEIARSRAIRAEEERAILDLVIAKAREEERLLRRLLVLRQGEVLQAAGGVEKEGSEQGDAKPEPAAVGESGHAALQAVLEELSVAGRPLHISELMRLLRERRVPIPGAGTQANLITHLRRDRRLVRPSRGMYGLTAWGLESMPPARRAKRRRKRTRSTASLRES